MIKVTQKNYSNCILGNKHKKEITMVEPFILAPGITQFNPFSRKLAQGFWQLLALTPCRVPPLILPTPMLPQLPPGCGTSPATTPGLPAPCQGKKQRVED